MVARAPGRTSDDGRDVSAATLLFVLLGAPVAWSIHLGVVYLLVTLLCRAGSGGGDVWVYLSGVPFLAVSVAAGVVGWRRRQLWRGAGWKSALARPHGSAPLLLVMGVVAAVVFSLLIALESLAPLFVATCAPSLQ